MLASLACAKPKLVVCFESFSKSLGALYVPLGCTSPTHASLVWYVLFLPIKIMSCYVFRRTLLLISNILEYTPSKFEAHANFINLICGDN